MTRPTSVPAIVLGLAAAALLAPAPSVAAGSERGLGRPLRLPTVAAGARCPATGGASATTLGRGLPRLPAAGSRPVYAIAVGGAPAGTLRVYRAYRGARGWVGQKAPWLIAPSYRGPLLIRGARIDAAGAMRFAFGTGQHLTGLRIDNHTSRRPSGWRAVPALTLVRGPGCYAYQVDGTTFSRIIVIKVVWAE